MVSDHYRDHWFPEQPYIFPTIPQKLDLGKEISRLEFELLKQEVENLKTLLIKAKKYDEETGQKDCQMDEKVAILKKIAEVVGVDLTEIFK